MYNNDTEVCVIMEWLRKGKVWVSSKVESFGRYLETIPSLSTRGFWIGLGILIGVTVLFIL